MITKPNQPALNFAINFANHPEKYSTQEYVEALQHICNVSMDNNYIDEVIQGYNKDNHVEWVWNEFESEIRYLFNMALEDARAGISDCAQSLPNYAAPLLILPLSYNDPIIRQLLLKILTRLVDVENIINLKRKMVLYNCNLPESDRLQFNANMAQRAAFFEKYCIDILKPIFAEKTEKSCNKNETP